MAVTFSATAVAVDGAPPATPSTANARTSPAASGAAFERVSTSRAGVRGTNLLPVPDDRKYPLTSMMISVSTGENRHSLPFVSGTTAWFGTAPSTKLSVETTGTFEVQL